MEYNFIESPLDVGHPNVVRFDMYDEHNRHMTVDWSISWGWSNYDYRSRWK